MEFREPMKIIYIGSVTLLGYEEEGRRSFAVDGTDYAGLADVLTALPQLTQPQHRRQLVQAVSFMESQDRFKPIEDAAFFKRRYLNLMKAPEDEVFPPLYRQYGPYVIDEVTEPKLHAGRLTWFVTDRYTEVPYRVSCNFPINGKTAETKYELLPAVSETTQVN